MIRAGEGRAILRARGRKKVDKFYFCRVRQRYLWGGGGEGKAALRRWKKKKNIRRDSSLRNLAGPTGKGELSDKTPRQGGGDTHREERMHRRISLTTRLPFRVDPRFAVGSDRRFEIFSDWRTSRRCASCLLTIPADRFLRRNAPGDKTVPR